jgi:hypothetical protein
LYTRDQTPDVESKVFFVALAGYGKALRGRFISDS